MEGKEGSINLTATSHGLREARVGLRSRRVR
jgi:hypothetical protein